jgi:hypothetical protein
MGEIVPVEGRKRKIKQICRNSKMPNFEVIHLLIASNAHANNLTLFIKYESDEIHLQICSTDRLVGR